MIENSGFNIYRFWISLAAFVVIVAGLKSASTILVPLILAIFIATISAPAILYLERFKVPRSIAFLSVLALVVFVLFGIGLILTNSLDSFVSSLDGYKQKVSILIV
ncbi:MAG TPA: hypothetical protein CFH79_08090, partial [Sulfurospirillum sp. UBA11407]